MNGIVPGLVVAIEPGNTVLGAVLASLGRDSFATSWVPALSILGAGLVFGLKHALDADHLAAVWTIVGARKSVFSSSLVGAAWGIGHTLALGVAAVVVMVLHVEISARTQLGLELVVALMLIGLGGNALWKIGRGARLHLHRHQHGGHAHLHPHVHDGSPEPATHTHHGLGFSTRPLLIGIVHGLAGSAALMLLVLSTIPSPRLGLAYVAAFGVGSIGGMMGMSVLLALPLHFTPDRFGRVHVTVRAMAALVSLGLGLSMAYEIGVGGGLLI